MAEIVGKDVSWIILAAAPMTSRISGAKTEEVCVMSTLTANLHLMMSQFYKPTSERYKLFCDVNAFPSDQVRDHPGKQRKRVLQIPVGGHSRDYSCSTLSLLKSGTTVLIPRTPSSRLHPEKASSRSGKKIYWTLSRKKAQRSLLFSSAPSRTTLHNGTR